MRAAEVGQSEVRSFDVLPVRPDPQVHVFRVAGLRVIDERESANDEVPDSVPLAWQSKATDSDRTVRS